MCILIVTKLFSVYGPKQTTIEVMQDIPYSGQDSNSAYPQFEAQYDRDFRYFTVLREFVL
jgi:hypothetical protein